MTKVGFVVQVYVCYTKQRPCEKKREAEVMYLLSWGESFKHLLMKIAHSRNDTYLSA